MCQPKDNPSTHSQKAMNASSTTSLPYLRLWPVSPWVIAALVPCLPTWCFLNRGYTQWFHWNSFFFLLTQNDVHAKFLAMQGLTVTLGWYASLLYDWYQHGRFAHILYWNMPEAMTRYMLNQQQQVVYNSVSIRVMLLAHLFDTLGHPILAYYFWKRSSSATSSIQKDASVFARFSWTVLILSYLLSRVWSILHTWYNQGTPALFYFGYDVYTLLDRDAWLEGLWLPAYVTEAVVYAIFMAGKILSKTNDEKSVLVTTRPTSLDRVPSTLLSSTVSEIDD